MKLAEDSKLIGGRGPVQDDHRISLGVSRAVGPVAQSLEETADGMGSDSHRN